MEGYNSVEDEIRACKKHRIANSIFTPLYAVVTSFLVAAGASNLSSEEGDSRKAALCALFAAYTSYMAFRGVKKQKALNKAIAGLEAQKKGGLEHKVE